MRRHDFSAMTKQYVSICFGVIYVLLIGACSPQEPGGALNTLTAEERSDGWTLLFDGKTFDGWRGLGRDHIPAGHWAIEDGTLKKIASGDVPRMADGQPVEGGDIMTERAYRNFELSFEWKISPGGNSGVKYNVSEEISTSIGGAHSALGFEYQVIDDQGYPGTLKDTQMAGALYDLIPPDPDKELMPVGEFNHTRIILQNNHGEHWLNGRKIVEFELGTPRLDSLIAASKFRDIPRFGEHKDGHIVIQDHVDAAWYRNIKIRELPDT